MIGAALVVLALGFLVYRLVPGPPPARPRAHFSEDEITAYDRALPKYFLVGLGALALGGLHAVIKDVPPIYSWLTLAGHGGHMTRDLANTHLVIVVGGTVTATGLAWYALPRVARRPLFSPGLASWSFWLTVVGAVGFYLANTVLGVVFGQYAHNGIDYDTAKPILGALRAVPIGMSAGIMGIGYWTFVAEVFLTVWAARRVEDPQPHRHLLKYFAVGAFGLFVGTVQGVIQVLPDNEAWIHAAAPAGEYIDPIAHAHINLVTGTLVLTAGLVFWWFSRAGVNRAHRRMENLVFWYLVPASILFYLSFMYLGFTEGALIVDGGLTYAQAVARMGLLHVVPLMVSGILTLSGVWLLLGTFIHRATWGPGRRLIAAPLILLGCVALFVGTGQGILQAIPEVKAWMVVADEPGNAIANAHAQLNMIGGVILMLLGLLLTDAGPLLGRAMPHRLALRIGRFAGAGIWVYYLSAIATALVMGFVVVDGGSLAEATARVASWGPIGMAIGAAIYGGAFTVAAIWAWRASVAYRTHAWRGLMTRIESYNETQAPWRQRIPARYYLMAEAVCAFAGFPGIGWIMSGRPLLGAPMAFAGCGISWAVIPLLMAPDVDGVFAQYGAELPLAWLSAITVLSTLSLALTLRHSAGLQRKVATQGAAARAAAGTVAAAHEP